jgi:hypothetical protein
MSHLETPRFCHSRPLYFEIASVYNPPTTYTYSTTTCAIELEGFYSYKFISPLQLCHIQEVFSTFCYAALLYTLRYSTLLYATLLYSLYATVLGV